MHEGREMMDLFCCIRAAVHIELVELSIKSNPRSRNTSSFDCPTGKIKAAKTAPRICFTNLGRFYCFY